MIGASQVSAVLVTRGDVGLAEIVASIRDAGIEDVIVWDNKIEEADVKVFGRYRGIRSAKNDTIYVQDDDCIVPVAEILAEYEPGERLCNMPANRTDYTDSALVGWGALFPAVDPWSAFTPYLHSLGQREGALLDNEFLRCCDVVFTTLAPFRRVDLGHVNLPWATGPNRMYTGEHDHYAIRAKVLRQARTVRDQAAAAA